MHLPEGASIVKTSKEVATLRIPGLPAAKFLKSDLSNFGTPRQCPSDLDLLRPREHSTDLNFNAVFVERICSHAESSRKKLTGEKLIRKSSQTAEDKNSLKANLVKVCRIKVPERREFVSSPRKKIFDNEVDIASASEDLADVQPAPTASTSTIVNALPAELTAITEAIVNTFPAELTANTSAIVDAVNDSILPQLSLDDSTLNVAECL